MRAKTKLAIALLGAISGVLAVAVCVRALRIGSERGQPRAPTEETARAADAAPSENANRTADKSRAPTADRHGVSNDATDVVEAPISPGKPRPSRQALRAALLLCARKDPRATGEWAIKHLPKGGDRAFVLRNAMFEWVARDPAAAFNWAEGIKGTDGRECALQAVFYAWAQSDAESASREAQRVEPFLTRSLAMGAIAHFWTEQDLAAATEWAWNLPAGPGQTYALANIARRLYHSDNEAAHAWALSLPRDAARDAVISGIASLVAPEDRDGAMAWVAQSIPGGVKPDPTFQIQLAKWALDNPGDATTWAAQLGEEEFREHALCSIALALIKSDIAAASSAVAKAPAGARMKQTAARIASYWAKHDSEAAAEWAGALADEEARDNALEAARSITETDEIGKEPRENPIADEKSDAERPPGNEASPAADSPDIGPDIFHLPWRELVPMVEQLPDGRLRNGLVHKAAAAWGKEDPKGAIAWVEEQLPDGRAMDTVLRVIIWHWVARDGDTASAWALNLPDGERREHALATVAMALARHNPEEAGRPAEAMAAGEAKNNVIRNVAYLWGLVNSNAAGEWLEGLELARHPPP